MARMYDIRAPRDLVDRRRLTDELDGLGGEGVHGTPEQRGRALKILKDALIQGRARVKERFSSGAGARATVHAQSYLVDQIIRLAYDFTVNRVFRLPNPTSGEKLALVAVGGYGRGQLAPWSDVDLLFLFPWKQTPWGEQVTEYLLYLLWDLGLKVGHATRNVDECIHAARADVTVRTAILEARWLWGEQDLFTELLTRFDREVVAKSGPDFLEAKLAERDQRHQRMGDSRYLVEPNVKEGKGGLRDLHTLLWLARYLYGVSTLEGLVGKGILTGPEAKRFARAEEFLLAVRCHLHYLAGRAEERLTFDVQSELARLLGYGDHPGASGVERFMKHYYLVAKDVGDLTRIFAAALEEAHKKKPRFSLRRKLRVDGFVIDGGRVNVGADDIFDREPVKLLRLFHLAQERALDVHPDALRMVRRSLKLVDATLRANTDANALFLDMLTSRKDPETTLRRLSEAGVFGRFVPDFGRVIAQMQHDMYHVYTVDEHTIRAIGILSRIESGALGDEHPLANEIVHQVVSRRVLYVAVLLHDIAKGRGGDHSLLGEQVAQKLCPRLGLTPAETETVAWLVRWHLLMSATAFKRDLNDAKTILDFGHVVQSPERLRLLLVLTVCDIRAVGPGVWNGWKGQLLRDLYWRAEEMLSGGNVVQARAERVKKRRDMVDALIADLPEPARTDFLVRHYDGYWLSTDPEAAARHAHLMYAADRSRERLMVEFRPDTFRAVTEMTLYAPDHPGLFARIAGAIAVAGGTVVDAKVHTTTDGMAIDTFLVQDADGGAFNRSEQLAKLRRAIDRTLAGEILPTKTIAADRPNEPARARVFTVQPVVLIDNSASGSFTVIEVNGRDRPGLLYDVTRALYELSLSIGSAHIATYGERAVDVFYVKDLVGMKVSHKGRLNAIERRLLDALRTAPERERLKREAEDAKRAPPRKPNRAAA
jgi:[protein-PII] uridylyltransferase